MHADTHNTWLIWNANETTAITASDYATQWQRAQQGTGDSIVVSAADGVQFYWNNWVGQQEETAEHRAAIRRHELDMEERSRAYAAARRAASERAEKLLEACLSTSQRESLRKNNWFVVYTKSGRAYQIRRGRARNVIEVNTKRTYCCHPVDNVPDADTMLAQKLMLESAEDEFLRMANVS